MRESSTVEDTLTSTHFAAMIFSAVIIGLCALTALAHGSPLGDAARITAVNATLQLIHRQISATLAHIETQSEMLPDSSCASLEMKELERAKQNLTAVNLAQFRCRMMKVSALTPDLLSNLTKISEHTQDVEQWLSSQVVDQKCMHPMFVQDGDCYVYIKCLLELLVELLTKAKL